MANNRHANVKAFRARLKIDGSRYSYANNFQPNKHAYFLAHVGSFIKQQTKKKNRGREETNFSNPFATQLTYLVQCNVVTYLDKYVKA